MNTMLIEPPHEARETEKLESLTQQMKLHGWEGRAVLVIEMADYGKAITGSHRLAAAHAAEIEPKCLVVKNRRLSAKQVSALEDAIPSLTWQDPALPHTLADAIDGVDDDEERVRVLSAVLGPDHKATRLMAEETAANAH